MNFRNPHHFQIQTERSNHTPGQPEEVRQPEGVVRSLTTAYTRYTRSLHHDSFRRDEVLPGETRRSPFQYSGSSDVVRLSFHHRGNPRLLIEKVMYFDVVLDSLDEILFSPVRVVQAEDIGQTELAVRHFHAFAEPTGWLVATKERTIFLTINSPVVHPQDVN